MNGENKKMYLSTEDKEKSSNALNIKQRQLRRSESSEYEQFGKAAGSARVRLRRTKHALILNVSSLVICVAMLTSSTFAWLSDTAKSEPIVVTAGDLQIDLLKFDSGLNEYVSVANGNVFDSNFKWEPGATQIVYLAVKNAGSLASKFNLILTVNDGGLADSLEYNVQDKSKDTVDYTSWDDIKTILSTEIKPLNSSEPIKNNVILDSKGDEATKYYTLAVHMKEGVDPAYMDKWVKLDLSVYATQASIEGDSVNSDYDEEANIPGPHTYKMGNINDAVRWGTFAQKLAGDNYKTSINKVVFGRWSEQKNNLKEKEFSDGTIVANEKEKSDTRAFYENGTLYILTNDSHGMIQAPRYMGNSFSGMFMDWTALTSVDCSCLDTSEVVSMQNAFKGCALLNEVIVGKRFTTPKVENMKEMFNGCSNLGYVDLTAFNSSQVADMSYMFNGCSSMTRIDLSSFNTSNVKRMNNMFCGCENVTEIKISPRLFNTSSVVSMQSMFDNCARLANIDVSGFDVSQSTSLQRMFFGCKSLQSLDLSSFSTQNVENMQAMFRDCSSLESITFGSNFKTSKVTTMQGMFNNCQSLAELDLTSFDTPNVTSMQGMFRGCRNLVRIFVTDANTNLNIGFLCTSLMETSSSKDMFLNCVSLNTDQPDNDLLKKYDPDDPNCNDKSYAFIGFNDPRSGGSTVPGYFRRK